LSKWIERVVRQSARIGYTAVMTAAIAHFMRKPSPILILMPTEAACRDYMVSDIESRAKNECRLCRNSIAMAIGKRVNLIN
jgi:phage terminase large subunit GpA-like protein